MRAINAIRMGGFDVLPLVEGGKGVSISTGISCGNWAAAGGVGTFSAVNADSFDAQGRRIPQVYHGRTRRERHEELVAYAIQGALTQARRAYELASGAGRIHANILWEMGAAERIITEVLEQAKGIINGITCGAGMPYRLSEIAQRFNVHYYPIISSARAFNALWKRAYSKASALLGGVVYEDPWLAGGHNGLSNSEDPIRPEDPYPRVLALRKTMREFGLDDTPIIMAGGVWWLEEWEDWIDNKELGPVAFQFGTRPLLTQESPIGAAWKKRLLTLKEGDIFLNKFSPTGFWSSAVNNGFIRELRGRSERQVAFTTETDRRACRRIRRRPAQAAGLSHARRSRTGARLGGGRVHRSAAHAGFHADLRDAGEGEGDHPGSGRLHGLPQSVPVLQLEPARGRPQQRQAARSAQLLHPEDAPEHCARQRRTRRGGAQPYVQRAQRLPLRPRSVLLERLRPHGEATGGTDTDRAVTPVKCRA